MLIMSTFIVDLLLPRYHRIAERHFTANIRNLDPGFEELQEEQVFLDNFVIDQALPYFSCFFVMIFFMGSIYYCSAVSSVTGTRSTTLWLITVASCLLYDSILVENIAIFLKYVILINRITGSEVQKVVQLLEMKT